MIKAILLDLGGVIVDLDIDKCRDAYRTRAGFENIDDILDPCIQKGFLYDLEAGAITPEDFFRSAREYCRPGVTDEEIAGCQCELLRSIDPAKAVYLRQLSERYPLYMLSNNNLIVLPKIRRMMAEAGLPMDSLFKDLFLSCEMKMMKPGLEIFRESVRLTGLPASELLFIDDSMTNVEAARAVGMNAAYYERGTDLAALIESQLQSI